MKDWDIRFSQNRTGIDKSGDFYDLKEEQRYQAFIGRMLDEGYILAKEKRWVKPAMFQVEDYFDEKNSTYEEAVKFFNYWDSMEWKRGKTRIKNWKLTANTWIKNNERFKQNNAGKSKAIDDEGTDWTDKL